MEIPIKYVRTGDDALAKMFHGMARSQLALLERRQALGNKETVHRVHPFPGVSIKCISFHNHREVQIHVEPSQVAEEQIKKELVDYLIVARGTGFNSHEGLEDVEKFIIAKAMIAPPGEYVYEFIQVANQIGRYNVQRFLQVRYVSEDKIASLCHYRDMPGGTDPDVSCVVEVVGEYKVPNFIKRVGTSGMLEAVLMAALSTSLDTLYVVYSLTEALTNHTDVYYEKYTPGVDGDGNFAWIQSGETIEIDFESAGLYFVDTNIDREGNICCFRSAEIDEPVDIYTSDGGTAFGYYPVLPSTSPVSASMSRITGVRTTVSFFTYNITDGDFVSSPKRLSQTVVSVEGSSWDYRHAEAGEYTKTSSVLNEAYGRGEAATCGAYSSQAFGSTSPYWRSTEGEFAAWSMGDLEFDTQNGNRGEVDGSSEWHNNCPPAEGGSGWREVTSSEKRGTISFNSIFSCITIGQNISRTDIYGELRSTWDRGWAPFFGGGTAYTWIILPNMHYVPYEVPPYTPINRLDMIHPFQIENIDGIHNAFISHDEETELTFAGVRYDDAEHDQQWEVRVFPPGSTEGLDITQQVKDAFYGQFRYHFDPYGNVVERTEEQKETDFESSFDCIYFKRGSMEV